MNRSSIILIKFEFCHAWLIFTWVIALYSNLVFQTFLCHFLIYWPEIWYINFFSRFTDQILLLSRLKYFLLSKCPLLKVSFSNFPMSPYKMMTWIFWRIYIDMIQIKFTFGPLWSAFVGIMTPKNLLGPVGDLFCLNNNNFRMLVFMGWGRRTKFFFYTYLVCSSSISVQNGSREQMFDREKV